MKNILAIVFIACVAGISGCAHTPKMQTSVKNFYSYKVANGPEDFVLDTLSSNRARLLVSCGIKRKGDSSEGMFQWIDLESKEVRRATVIKPSDIYLFPHGIDLMKKNDSLFIYAVNHEDRAKGTKDYRNNSVLKFLLRNDTLFFMQKTVAKCIVAPNAVCALSDGSFLVSNMNTGSVFSSGNICYCNSDTCYQVSKKIFYANGITRDNNYVYVASTMGNKIIRYTFSNGVLYENLVIKKIYGGDNLRIVNDTLYVAAHLNINKFLKHVKKPESHSPSAIYEIPLANMHAKLIFYNDGTVIEASSTALKYKGKYYITGVFNPKVVEVEM